MSRPPYVMVPVEMLQDRRIAADAIRLWALLDDALRDEQTVLVATRTQLADAIGVGWRQLVRLTGQLVAGGWLRTATAGRAGNLYEPLRRPRFDRQRATVDVVHRVGDNLWIDR